MSKPVRPRIHAMPFLNAGDFRPRAVLRMALLGAVVASLVSVPGLATAAPSPPAKPSPAPTNAATFLGVTVAPGGWIKYNNLGSKLLPLTGVKTSTVTGRRVAAGGCEFAEAPSSASTGTFVYTEQTALNPTSCTATVLTGHLTEAAGKAHMAKFEAQSPATATAKASTTVARGQAATAKAASPTYYGHAYTMSRWIDPVNVVITSQAINLNWPLYGKGGMLTASWPSYKFRYDGWTQHGPYFAGFKTMAGDKGWSARAGSHFINYDFAAYVLMALGPAGWLACGAPRNGRADFRHDVAVFGHRSGARGYGATNSATGACSNLVHQQTLTGYGTWK